MHRFRKLHPHVRIRSLGDRRACEASEKSVAVSCVMQHDVPSLPPDLPMSKLGELTASRRTQLMPVAASDGRPMGLVPPLSKSAETVVRDAMMEAVCVPEDASIETCVEMMLRKRINTLLVTADGRYVGVVTALDLLQQLHRSGRV